MIAFKIYLLHKFSFLSRVLLLALIIVGSQKILFAKDQKSIVKGGWQQRFPYQYLSTPIDLETLTGLDIDLQKIIFSQAGIKSDLVYLSWEEHLYALKEGRLQFAMGVYKTKELLQHYNFSKPYRFEESAIFFRKEDSYLHRYKSIDHFISEVKKKKYKIGVIRGYNYASKALNDFVTDPKNQSNLIFVLEDVYNIAMLLKNRIDIFISDRVVASNYIARSSLGSRIKSESIGIKSPIHFMFSKKSFSEESLSEINKAIDVVLQTDVYKNALISSIFPIWVLNTVESEWYRFLELLGIVAFVFSGLVLSYINHASLLGTIIYCGLPTIGGFFARDLILGRFPVSFVQNKYNLLILFLVSVVGFFIGRLINLMELKMPYVDVEAKKQKLSDISAISDAIGLSCFAAVGVLSTFVIKAQPLYLWGTVFAFITGAMGCVFRDMISRESVSEIVYGRLYSEYALFMGFFLSLFISFNINKIEPSNMKYVVLSTVFINSLLMILGIVFKIKNIKIKALNSYS